MPQRTLQARDAVTVTPPQRADRPLRIRDASHADIDMLLPIINDAYRRADGHIFPGGTRTSADALRAAIDTPGSRLIVAAAGNTLAGCVHLEMVEHDAHFGLLATAVEHQRHGVARTLIAHVERVATTAGRNAMRIEIIREVGLQPYYEALGYRVMREVPGDDWPGAQDWGAVRPWTMVEMRKRLIGAPPARTADSAVAAGVRFRTAAPDDIPELAAMINRAYLREAWLLPPPRTTERELLDELARPETRLIVAELDREIAGSVCVTLHGDEPDFGLFAVLPRFQGRGLARLLIECAEHSARAAGYRSMRLDCAKELGLPPYYESLGYRVVSEERGLYFGSVEPVTRVTMRKELG